MKKRVSSPRLDGSRSRFHCTVNGELAFVSSLGDLHYRRKGKCCSLSATMMDRLSEMAFLRLFIAWEEFLNASFEEYLITAPGKTAKPRIAVLSSDRQCAKDVILGEKRQFVEWSDPAIVRQRAAIFFKGGEPFESALSIMLVHLNRMRTVRNRTVHHSDYAADKFHSMIRELYGQARKMTPGGFLRDTPPAPLIPPGQPTANTSVFELFAQILMAGSKKIVP